MVLSSMTDFKFFDVLKLVCDLGICVVVMCGSGGVGKIMIVVVMVLFGVEVGCKIVVLMIDLVCWLV